MNEPKYAERSVYKVVIRAPIETVWSELINTSSPRPFFWNSGWDTKNMAAGSAYRMVSQNGKTVAVVGDILEIEPPHRMVTSFRLTGLDDPPSRVTYELKEIPDGTEFMLITENIIAGSRSEKSMADGAKFIVENFKAFMETGNVTLGARLVLFAFRFMSPLAPKSMRAENWPLDK